MVDLMGKPGSATIRENIALFVDKVNLTTDLHVSLNIGDPTNLYSTQLVIQSADKGEVVRAGFWGILCCSAASC